MHTTCCLYYIPQLVLFSDKVYVEHKRAVSKVTFHNNEWYLLLSGSQDGYMKMFVSTICFLYQGFILHVMYVLCFRLDFVLRIENIL